MTLAIVGLLAAVNPAAAALTLLRDRRTDRPVPIAAGVAAAVVALTVLAIAAETLLDALDVNLGTYRLGAGVVVAFAGLRWLVAGAQEPVEEPGTDRGLAGFVAFPTILTPGAAALAVSIGADDGIVAALVGSAVAGVAGGVGVYLRRNVPPALVAGLVRLLGAVGAIVGVLVAVDGVRTL